MNESQLKARRYRYSFMRNDGNSLIFSGLTPEDAWENLCESYDNDSHFIKKFFDRMVNKQAISKGYRWLNEWIGESFDKKYTNEEYGPVFLEL